MPRVSNHERFLKEEGKLEGKLEGKQETVIELLRNGVDIEIVIKSTGFSREEVEKLVETVY